MAEIRFKTDEVLLNILQELKSISKSLIRIESKLNLNDIEKYSNNGFKSEKRIDSSLPSSLDIMELQDKKPGIFKTYITIQKQSNWLTSENVSKITGRSRGLESRYLNYLAEMGTIDKKRVKVNPKSKATEVLYRFKGVEE